MLRIIYDTIPITNEWNENDNKKSRKWHVLHILLSTPSYSH